MPIALNGTFAERPSSAELGQVYFVEDAPYICRWGGSAWETYGPLFAMEEPPTSGWSWVNQGTSTVVENKGFISLGVPDNSATSPSCRVRSTPSAPYEIKVAITVSSALTAENDGGLLWNASSTDNAILIRFLNGSVVVQQFTAPATFGTAYATVAVDRYPDWVILGNDGTERYVEIGQDDGNAREIYRAGNATHITENEWGIYGRVANIAISKPVAVTLHSVTETEL